jgi:DnaJ-class molecular chaperone
MNATCKICPIAQRDCPGYDRQEKRIVPGDCHLAHDEVVAILKALRTDGWLVCVPLDVGRVVGHTDELDEWSTERPVPTKGTNVPCSRCGGSGEVPERAYPEGGVSTTCSTCGGSGESLTEIAPRIKWFRHGSSCPTCGGTGTDPRFKNFTNLNKPCSTCGGTGNDFVVENSYVRQDTDKPCPTCGGEGCLDTLDKPDDSHVFSYHGCPTCHGNGLASTVDTQVRRVPGKEAGARGEMKNEAILSLRQRGSSPLLSVRCDCSTSAEGRGDKSRLRGRQR